jgi:ferredoxin
VIEAGRTGIEIVEKLREKGYADRLPVSHEVLRVREMERNEELRILKARLQLLESQISFLEGRVREIEHRSRPSFFKATVHPERCSGCGTCEASCSFGAIVVRGIAWIDARRCIGCGSCVEVCLQGAISLHAERFERKEKNWKNLLKSLT